MTDKKNLPARIQVPSYLQKLFTNMNLVPITELPNLPIPARLDAATKCIHMGWALDIYSGFALMGVKEEVGHGNYIAALADRGLTPMTASRRVRRAELSRRVGAANITALLNIDPSKADLIADWSDSDLKDFFAGERVNGITLEDAQGEPIRELQHRIKEADADIRAARDDAANARKKLGDIQDQLVATEQALRDARSATSLSARAGLLRAEVLDLVETGRDALTRLRTAIEAISGLQASGANTTEILPALHPALWGLQGIHELSAVTLTHAKARHQFEDDALIPLVQLDKHEVDRMAWLADQFSARAHERAAQAAATAAPTTPKKRGPKPGSKRKARS